MENNSQKITEIWALLREKEKQNGLNYLSLIERDILENLAFLIDDKKQLSLDIIYKQCNYPRATFFRTLKKLREKKIIKIVKQIDDKRKSNILLLKNINK